MRHGIGILMVGSTRRAVLLVSCDRPSITVHYALISCLTCSMTQLSVTAHSLAHSPQKDLFARLTKIAPLTVSQIALSL